MNRVFPKTTLFFFFLFFFSLNVQAAEKTREVIATLDYIAGDYHNAVTPSGEIKNKMEYDEMLDFSQFIIDRLVKDQPALLPSAQSLKTIIQKKGAVTEVDFLADSLKQELIKITHFKSSPDQMPDLALGMKLYQKNCSGCHGVDGKAATPMATTLNPAPRNFTDPAVVGSLSLFKVFNTITLGITGTPMPSYAQFSEDERWAMAAAVISFGDQSSLSLAIEQIQKSEQAFQMGNKEAAMNLAVSAYLDGFEKNEALLQAHGREDLVLEAESLFLSYRQDLRGSNSTLVNQKAKKLLQILNEGATFLESGKEFNAGLAFLASFTILVREGLEAILLIVIILSIVKSLGDERGRKIVHIGWVLALLVGFFTWFLAKNIISGASREGMEGWVSLVASLIMIYVSYWLFAKSDVQRWKNFLVGKIKGRGIGFATVGMASFLAVYRETFETILFLETLKIHAPNHTLALAAGSVCGVVFLVIPSYAITRLHKKLPLNLFFNLSGSFLYLLAVVFVGQGLHNLQEAGLVNLTPVSFITFPIFGIYPSFQTLLSQLFLMLVFGVSILWQYVIKSSSKKFALQEKAQNTFTEL